MLDKIDLKKKMDKEEYKTEIDVLEQRLNSLQQKIKELGIPVIIVFEGWSSSGKGTLISKLLNPLDPRYFNVYTLNRVSEESLMRPVLWSYWTKTPLKGRISILDKSYHRINLPEGIDDWNLKELTQNKFYYDVNAFEKQLSDDGTLIIKLFIHISKEEQKRRLEKLQKDPETKWRVNKRNFIQNENYDKYLKLYEDMIYQTNSSINLWNIIEADDSRYATVKIFKTIINRIEQEVKRRTETVIDKNIETPKIDIIEPSVSILDSVDLSKTISDEEYKEKIDYYQKKIRKLGYKMYTKRKSVVIVYEGWDAAGKGGNIKRLTQKLDPRGYEVVPIASPSKEELDHHYLWRFWNKMPKDGHLAIFDRSWYGRVMVERIEGFCSESEWKRAYREINDMELHMANHGTFIVKFWLHIDKDEQLARFKSRQEDPLKQYKITDEDWRNRDKWDKYETAVNEMLFRTSTEYAPWVIVESNNKKYARIKVLKYVVENLEKFLG